MLRRSSRKQSSAMTARPHASASSGELASLPSPALARPGGDGWLPSPPRLTSPRSNLNGGGSQSSRAPASIYRAFVYSFLLFFSLVYERFKK
jgi:hypothetical protein